jgi:ubiquitin-activating enzyme E1
LHEADIGKQKDEVTAPRLAELNSYVPVHVMKEPLSTATIKNFKVVVVTGKEHEDRLVIGDLARSAGVYFIAAETVGLFG